MLILVISPLIERVESRVVVLGVDDVVAGGADFADAEEDTIAAAAPFDLKLDESSMRPFDKKINADHNPVSPPMERSTVMRGMLFV
ncbi:hypothetical protein HDU67_008709 [Dinochytrium kinnereticum]|nr:hypothetical protein HDU67_008709 [Dinochytrium kinnereticum]